MPQSKSLPRISLRSISTSPPPPFPPTTASMPPHWYWLTATIELPITRAVTCEAVLTTLIPDVQPKPPGSGTSM